MRKALDDVSFLARSEHRVTVLELLTDGGKTRADVREATGIPQATLGRILEDFVDRGWAKTEGRTYSLTPFGEVLAEEFGTLLGTVESMQNIEGIAQLLPEDAPDPRHFADARVVRPTPSNVLAHIEESQRMLNEAQDTWVVTPTVFPDALRNEAERGLEGVDERSSLSVIGGEALDLVLASPELSAITREFLERADIDLYRYDGPIDCLLAIVDGTTVVVGPLDENGVPQAYVESANPVVKEWAKATFDRYLEEGTRVTVDDLPE